MAISLKISNVLENLPELLLRVKKIQSPGKKVLVSAITSDNKQEVIKELLYRLELYTKLKVLNYTRQDLSIIVGTIHKFGFNVVLESMIKSYVVIAEESEEQTDEEFIRNECDEFSYDLAQEFYPKLLIAVENGEIDSREDYLEFFEDNEEYETELHIKIEGLGIEPEDVFSIFEADETAYNYIHQRMLEQIQEIIDTTEEAEEDLTDDETNLLEKYGPLLIDTFNELNDSEISELSLEDFVTLVTQSHEECLDITGDGTISALTNKQIGKSIKLVCEENGVFIDLRLVNAINEGIQILQKNLPAIN